MIPAVAAEVSKTPAQTQAQTQAQAQPRTTSELPSRPLVTLPPVTERILQDAIDTNVKVGDKDLNLLVDKAQTRMEEIRKDPSRVHVLGNLLRFLAKTSWALTRLTFGMGLAWVQLFIDLFQSRILGIVALVIVLAISGGMAYITGEVLSALVAFLVSPAAFKLTVAVFRAAGAPKRAWDRSTLYHKLYTNNPSSFLSRRWTNVKDMWFRAWNNGIPLHEWILFERQYKNLFPDKSELNTMWALKYEDPVMFQAFLQTKQLEVTGNYAGIQARAQQQAALASNVNAAIMATGVAPRPATTAAAPRSSWLPWPFAGGRGHRVHDGKNPKDAQALAVLTLATTGRLRQ